ncbi:MAG: hypothetical protein O3B13_01140 [Planctomycetota bacterium]|nr:hypothetical protein [Planctomycetota bacterium]
MFGRSTANAVPHNVVKEKHITTERNQYDRKTSGRGMRFIDQDSKGVKQFDFRRSSVIHSQRFYVSEKINVRSSGSGTTIRGMFSRDSTASTRVQCVDGRIRRAHCDGMGIRETARRFHHSRQKVRQILRGESEPRTYAKRSRQRAPKLGPFQAPILEILKEYESAPPKHRDTAMRIFERLRDEVSDGGRYQGGYCR